MPGNGDRRIGGLIDRHLEIVEKTTQKQNFNSNCNWVAKKSPVWIASGCSKRIKSTLK